MITINGTSFFKSMFMLQGPGIMLYILVCIMCIFTLIAIVENKYKKFVIFGWAATMVLGLTMMLFGNYAALLGKNATFAGMPLFMMSPFLFMHGQRVLIIALIGFCVSFYVLRKKELKKTSLDDL